MGRRKIKIQPLSDDRNRTVTFVKRKAGLFKKAYELSVLCQVDLAVIIVGNNNKVYEFLLVDTKPLLECYHARAPHELKLPENYGPYKKKAQLMLKSVPEGDLPDLDPDAPSADDGDDYDSETPEPKRKKKDPTLYAAQPPQPPQPPQQPQPQFRPANPEELPQRPVLRVQIPVDAKSTEDSEKTVTAHTAKKDLLAPPELPNIYKLKSPEGHRMPAITALSQPSPSEQYPPAILPTPVFNQFAAYGNAPPSAHPLLLPADDHPRSKPPFQQHYPPEQALMSALPSRYVSDIFPSPLTLYPQQEWPTGLTPYQSNMPHYFVSMVPGATALPVPVNAMYLGQRPPVQLHRQYLYPPPPPPDPQLRDYKKSG